jgi:DNA-binding CsgD family transcriptional regulator
MLYGSEVERPAGFEQERVVMRVRRMGYEAPMRRKVLSRLRNGWSDFQIARELGVSINAVRCQVRLICREEGVGDRQELAAKLKFAVSPPLNQEERAGARRFLVKEMMMGGATYGEMMEKLSVSRDVLKYDIRMIRRMYGVKKLGKEGRREMGEKIGGEESVERSEERRGVR